VTSYKLLRSKLTQKLMELPESRKHEPAMEFKGKMLTWWQIAVRLRGGEKKIRNVKALVRRAEEVGLIRSRTGG